MRVSAVDWLGRERCSLLVVTIMVLVMSLVAGAFGQDTDDLRRRMEALQQQMQEALSKGQPPPPEVLKELQNLLPTAQQMEQQQAGDWSPFSEREGWRRIPFKGTITVHRTVNFNHFGGGDSISKNENAYMTISVNDTMEVDVAGKKQLYPTGKITTNINGREVWHFDTGGSMSHTYQLSGNEEFGYDPEDAPQRRITLEVNDERKLFRLDTPMGEAEGSCETVVKVGLTEQRSTSTISTEVAAWFPDGCGRIDEESFSPEAGIITDNYSMVGYQAPGSVPVRDGDGAVLAADDPILQQARQHAPDQKMIPVRYQVNWNLYTRDKRPRVVLEPDESYDTWVPELPQPDAGRTIALKARIIEPTDVQGVIRFELRDVSEEPGTCLNKPAKDGDTDPDLIIPEDLNSAELAVEGDEMSAETHDDVREARVVVRTRDWGAYGKLHAIAKLHIGGQEIEVPAVYEAAGTSWVTIPKDEDDNSIADEWQRQNGVENCSGAADDDETPEGSGPGDGLSVYEEYRGVSVRGNHVRLDPTVKDLFIYDPDGLAADSYLERATHGLKVRYVTADEMRCGGGGDSARVINFNHDRYHVVDQHGIHVKAEHGSKGRHNWGLCHGAGPPGPPVTCNPHVAVYVDQIEDDVRHTFNQNETKIRESLAEKGITPDEMWLRGHIRDAIRMVTAHEACHGLGIPHHTKTMPPGATQNTANPSTGWLVCIMRYPWDGGMAGVNPIKAANEVLYILQGKFPWAYTLCTTMDNCAAELTVSDVGH